MENYNQQPLDFSEEMKFYTRRKKRRAIGWGIASPFLAALLIVIIAMFTASAPRVDTVTKYDGDNRYITFDTAEGCMLSAHRAGGTLAPENTLNAMENCMTAGYVVDVLEFDLHITKDGQLILLHDDTLNRTSNAEEIFGEKKCKPSDHTLVELKQLNMGEHFEDTEGNYPYRGLRGDAIPADLRVATLDEVIAYTESVRTDGSLNYIIEIKDGGDNGRCATDELYRIMEARGITNRTIIGTFQGEITKYMDEKYPTITRSASIAEVLDFYYAFIFNVDLNKKDYGFEVLQIPYKLFGLNLGFKSVIDYAHHYGIAVQYWTINDPQEIRELIERGADCIMTDDPATAHTILQEYKNKSVA